MVKIFAEGTRSSAPRRFISCIETVRWASSHHVGSGTGVQSSPTAANDTAGGDGKVSGMWWLQESSQMLSLILSLQTMMAGITMIVAGFGVFWYLQAWKQGRNALEDPYAKVPTCAYIKSIRIIVTDTYIDVNRALPHGTGRDKGFPARSGQTLVTTPMANITASETLPRPNDGKNFSPGVVAYMLGTINVRICLFLL